MRYNLLKKIMKKMIKIIKKILYKRKIIGIIKKILYKRKIIGKVYQIAPNAVRFFDDSVINLILDNFKIVMTSKDIEQELIKIFT